MDEIQLENTIYGSVLALVAFVSLVIVLAELRRGAAGRDREVISISGGFALMCAIFALVLMTGWVDYLPLPR
jgi:hypothetical protein